VVSKMTEQNMLSNMLCSDRPHSSDHTAIQTWFVNARPTPVDSNNSQRSMRQQAHQQVCKIQLLRSINLPVNLPQNHHPSTPSHVPRLLVPHQQVDCLCQAPDC
jgi:hypothetical protein